MSLKESLTDFVAKSQTFEDILPFISLLPLENIKSAVSKCINELQNESAIRRVYYKNVNIEHFMALDLLSYIISYLPMNQICAMSRTSKTINKASNIASKQEDLCLSIFKNPRVNDTDSDASTNHINFYHFKDKEITYSKGFFRLVKMDIYFSKPAQNILKRFWNQFECISAKTNIFKIMNLLNLKFSPNLLSFSSYYPMQSVDWFAPGLNLESVCIILPNTSVWNILIRNCPNLHRIYFNFAVEFEASDKPQNLLIAENLWSLVLTYQDRMDYMMRKLDLSQDLSQMSIPSHFVHGMIQSSPNLYHLSVDAVLDSNQKFIFPTKNLISLSIGEQTRTSTLANIVSHNLNECFKLIYLDIPMYINQPDRFVAEPLCVFINNQAVSNIVYIGVTDSLPLEDAILDRRNGDEPEGIFRNFRNTLIDEYNCNEKSINNCRIVSGGYGDDDDYIKKFAVAVTKSNFIRKRTDRILHFVATKALDKNNEFMMFWKGLINMGEDLIGDYFLL